MPDFPQFPGIQPSGDDFAAAMQWLANGGQGDPSVLPGSVQNALSAIGGVGGGTMGGMPGVGPATNGDGRWWGANAPAAQAAAGGDPASAMRALVAGANANAPAAQAAGGGGGNAGVGGFLGGNPQPAPAVGGVNQEPYNGSFNYLGQWIPNQMPFDPSILGAMGGGTAVGFGQSQPDIDPSVLGAMGGGTAAGIGQPANTGAVGGGVSVPQGGNYPMGSFLPGAPGGGGMSGGFVPPGTGLNPNLMGGGASGPAMPSYGSQGGQAMPSYPSGPAMPSYSTGNIPYPSSTGQGGMPLPPTGTTVPAAGLVDPQTLLGQYQSSFNAAKNANEDRYNTILQGYRNMIGTQGAASQALLGGYQDRYNQVMNDINGMGASQKQDITDKYARQQGSATQSLISRGLGNTTVVDSVGRGIASDEARANIALNDALSRERAQYRSGLLGDALQAQQAGAGVNANLTGNMLNFQERRTDAYPDANFYGNLIQQSGAQQQANANAANNQAQQQYINYLSMFNPNYADQTQALQGLYGAPLGSGGNIPGLTPTAYR